MGHLCALSTRINYDRLCKNPEVWPASAINELINLPQNLPTTPELA